MSLVVRQSTLHLTESLFGNSSSFEVLKFPGGITVIPTQSAFLPQAHHASFNFTLNFPIYKVQDRTDELKDQMKAGLLLNSNEVSATSSPSSLFVPSQSLLNMPEGFGYLFVSLCNSGIYVCM